MKFLFYLLRFAFAIPSAGNVFITDESYQSDKKVSSFVKLSSDLSRLRTLVMFDPEHFIKRGAIPILIPGRDTDERLFSSGIYGMAHDESKYKMDAILADDMLDSLIESTGDTQAMSMFLEVLPVAQRFKFGIAWETLLEILVAYLDTMQANLSVFGDDNYVVLPHEQSVVPLNEDEGTNNEETKNEDGELDQDTENEGDSEV